MCVIFIFASLLHLHICISKVCPVPWSESWAYSHSSHLQSSADVGLMCCWWCCCCYCCFQMWTRSTAALVRLTPCSPICLYSRRSWSSWWIWTQLRERQRSGSGGPQLPCPPAGVSGGLPAWPWVRPDRGHVHRPGIGRGRASSGCAVGCSYPDSGSADNSV